MSELIDEIRVARETVVLLESETSESGRLLRLSKEKLRKARGELDTLLQELCTGQSRYALPGFDRIVPGNGQASGNGHVLTPDTFHAVEPVLTTEADETPVRVEPPLRGRGRKR